MNLVDWLSTVRVRPGWLVLRTATNPEGYAYEVLKGGKDTLKPGTFVAMPGNGAWPITVDGAPLYMAELSSVAYYLPPQPPARAENPPNLTEGTPPELIDALRPQEDEDARVARVHAKAILDLKPRDPRIEEERVHRDAARTMEKMIRAGDVEAAEALHDEQFPFTPDRLGTVRPPK